MNPGDDGQSSSGDWSGWSDDGSKPSDRIRWFFATEDGVVAFVREVLGSVLAVAFVGLLLFAISGLWPPMVAVESGSMQPNLQRGDLVFVMEEHRLAPETAYGDTGVVTARIGERTGYAKFHGPGDVVVYRKNGDTGGTPIIHRAMFWVNESENWYDKADPDAVGSAENCGQLENCPAPHAGFVTKGDNDGTNSRYDQVTGLSSPVRPAWVIGTAEVRIPLLGYVRLLFGQVATGPPDVEAAVVGSGHGDGGYAGNEYGEHWDGGRGDSESRAVGGSRAAEVDARAHGPATAARVASGGTSTSAVRRPPGRAVGLGGGRPVA